MTRYVLRRLVTIPIVLILAHFAGYVYTSLAQYIQIAQNPFGSGQASPPQIWSGYKEYLSQLSRVNLSSDPIFALLGMSFVFSAVLLLAAFVLSSTFGILLGVSSVRLETKRVSWWMNSITTVGQAIPAFYLGTVFIYWIVTATMKGDPGAKPLLPVFGGGFDAHLILPILVLMIRPTLQIAKVTGETLAGELGENYVVAMRAFGAGWKAIRRKYAFRNLLVPITLTIAASLRLLLGELILVEWLFAYPGMGSLLARTLVPPNLAYFGGLTGEGNLFLDPGYLTPLVTLFALFFLITDSVVSILVRLFDPRLRLAEEATNAIANL
jgi:peptide/nickel transport system permease protein